MPPRFHWFWPFIREEELPWAIMTARPGEQIVLQSIDREAAPRAGRHGPVTVVRDLPDVRRNVSRSAWLLSRSGTYLQRAVARQRLARSSDFDLLHIHYFNRFTDFLAPLTHPLVISVHDVLPHQARLGRGEQLLARALYRRADALVVHHEALRDRLVEALAVPSGKIHVVPHQVFEAPPTPAPPRDHPPMVLLFGALRPNKGLEVLLDAVTLMAGEELRVTIAGRGSPHLEAMAREAAEADPRIHVEIGFADLERKHQLFADASLVVLPYTAFESQSGVLHDAYAQSRPVVVSDVGALGETVRQDGTGLVVTPGDSNSLAEAIREVVQPREWALFAAAANRVRADRSPERCGERLRTVYDSVL